MKLPPAGCVSPLRMAPTRAEPRPRPSNAETPEEAAAGPIKKLFLRANTQVNRFTAFIGLHNKPVGPQDADQAEPPANSSGMKQSQQITESSSSLDSSVDTESGPEMKKALKIALRIGAGVLAVVVVLRAGSRKGRAKVKAKAIRAPVKPGVRMADDISKKAHAAAASVEQAAAAASHSVETATVEAKGVAMKATDGLKAAAGKTKGACLQAKDACLKATSEAKVVGGQATSDAREAAAETKAICDAALEGASVTSRLAYRPQPDPLPSSLQAFT